MTLYIVSATLVVVSYIMAFLDMKKHGVVPESISLFEILFAVVLILTPILNTIVAAITLLVLISMVEIKLPKRKI